MKLFRTAVVALVGAGLLLGSVAASAIEYTPIPARVGARFDARAHIAGHSWDAPFHTAKGRIGLINRAERSRKVYCTVAIQFQDKDGTARAIAWADGWDKPIYVGPNSKRVVSYGAVLKDKKHRFGNVPVRANAHCRVAR